MRRTLSILALFIASVCLSATADITIGVTLGATGPGASIGTPNKNVFAFLPTTIAGEKVRYIIYDDATDPTNAVKNVRRLITEDNVDVIIGSSSTPTVLAAANVAAELKTPQIACAPAAAANSNPWLFDTAQPTTIMMQAVVEHMKAHGVKTIAFIGFSDAWGDLVYSGFAPQAEAAGMKIVANERYARTDTTVTGQVAKIISLHPDAVVVGGSATPGALPHMTLVERGYKGPIYHSHGVVNKDFLRVGGKSVEGAIAPVGPVMVAEQLPDSNPIKGVALEFLKKYEGTYGAGSRNGFAPSSYDAFLLISHAVPVALKKAKPGTPEFRQALRDALENTKNVVGSFAVYNMTPTDHFGVDSRARVLVTVKDGEWKLLR
jgi:branched-chain amino acid transport system substrate-binding protein